MCSALKKNLFMLLVSALSAAPGLGGGANLM